MQLQDTECTWKASSPHKALYIILKWVTPTDDI